MKEYLRKIWNIVTIKDETLGYIEKDTKKTAKKTYRVIKNICILITALIFAHVLVNIRIEGVVNAFENNKELEFSITKEGLEFDNSDTISVKEYVINDELDIITVNDKDIDLKNEEQYNKIYGKEKNKVILSKEKMYVYENNMLRKAI